jgi:hypothetical protein
MKEEEELTDEIVSEWEQKIATYRRETAKVYAKIVHEQGILTEDIPYKEYPLGTNIYEMYPMGYNVYPSTLRSPGYVRDIRKYNNGFNEYYTVIISSTNPLEEKLKQTISNAIKDELKHISHTHWWK